MAILKSGSTVGGNLILHQGMLPLYPKGDSLHYKNYKIYTELDKPTPTELNVYDKPQLDRMFSRIDVASDDNKWVKLGVFKSDQGAQTLSIEVVGGSGYNGLGSQQSRTFITLRTGNASVNVNEKGRIAMSISNMATPGLALVKNGAIIETSNATYDVYLLMASYSVNSIVEVHSSGIALLSSVWEFKNEIQATAPVGVQEVRVSEIYTTARRPSPEEIGLGNVTNDAQVKKAGDTMTGQLTVGYNNNGTDSLLHLRGNTLTPFRMITSSFDKMNIGFQLKSYIRYLGPADDQRLTYGTNIDSNLNPMVYTTERKPTPDDVQSFYRDPNLLEQRNLNDIMYPGTYGQNADSNCTPERNYPLNRAGTLNVYKNGANGTGIIQEYKLYNQDLTFSRRKSNDTTWSGWSKTYSEENKPTNSDVGLSNVTNDAQIKRNGDSVNGNIGFSAGIRTNDIPSGNTYHWNAFKVDAASSKTYLRGFRSGISETMWHETVEGFIYRISTGPTDSKPLFEINSANKNIYAWGKLVSNTEVAIDTHSNSPFQFRAIAGAYGMGIRNDGATTYFLLTAANDQWGSWENKAGSEHPLWFDNASRDVTIGNFLNVRKGINVVSTGERGAIKVNGVNTGPQGSMIFGEVQGGQHADWRTRGAAVSISCPNAPSQAYNVWKAVHWGADYLAAVDVHAGTSGSEGYIVRHLIGGQAFNMHGNGDMSIPRNLYVGDVHINSDERLKSNFEHIENALDKVDHLSGLIYDKKQKAGKDTREAGIIAQRLRDVLPEAVGDNGEFLNISPSGVNALLVEAIKELRREVKQQRVLIEKLSEK